MISGIDVNVITSRSISGLINIATIVKPPYIVDARNLVFPLRDNESHKIIANEIIT